MVQIDNKMGWIWKTKTYKEVEEDHKINGEKKKWTERQYNE
jgi:hypothetical protein